MSSFFFLRHDIIKHSIIFPGGLASPSHNVIDEAEPSSLMPDATQTHNGETHNLIAQQAFEAGGGGRTPAASVPLPEAYGD